MKAFRIQSIPGGWCVLIRFSSNRCGKKRGVLLHADQQPVLSLLHDQVLHRGGHRVRGRVHGCRKGSGYLQGDQAQARDNGGRESVLHLRRAGECGPSAPARGHNDARVIYGMITAAKMRKLEAQLPEAHRTKLVLTKEEVALRISDFYNGTLRMALADDLKNPDSKKIYNHIQLYDDDKLPNIR